MKTLILAAGRGERMRPLTDQTPKPLLPVAGEPLIVHTIKRLSEAGFSELVINLAHLGDQIEEYLQQGARWDVKIQYSREVEALETAGGIIQALPLLGDDPFLVVNGDIWTDFDYSKLNNRLPNQVLAHLVLVNNPLHHPGGDFCLEGGRLTGNQGQRLTYSGIGVYSPDLFAGFRPGKRALAPILHNAVSRALLSGERYGGQWRDIGTPERLEELNQLLS